MGFRERNPSIPGTSRQAKCRRNIPEGGKCNKDAHNFIQGEIEVMGKPVSVRIPMCDDHFKELTNDPDGTHYSIEGQ